MQPRLKKMLIVGLGISIAGLLFISFRKTPEEEIQSLLDQITASASFERAAHPLEYLSWAAKLANYCKMPCHVALYFEDGVREYSEDKRESVQHLAAVRKELDQLAVKLLTPKITVVEDKAIVRGSARATGRSPGRDDYFLEMHEIELELIKEDGEWIVKSLKNLDKLQTD